MNIFYSSETIPRIATNCFTVDTIVVKMAVWKLLAVAVDPIGETLVPAKPSATKQQIAITSHSLAMMDADFIQIAIVWWNLG